MPKGIPLDEEKFKELYERGLNDCEIAHELNTHQPTICNLRKRMGLEPNVTRGRVKHDFLKEELQKQPVIFSTDYPQETRIKLYTDSHNENIKRIVIPRIRNKGAPSIRKRIIYCRRGNEEEALKVYLERLPQRVKDYFANKPRTKSKKFSFIRKFFM